MQATLYHGTDTALDLTTNNPQRGRFDLCLTDDADVAAGYGDTVHTIRFNGVTSDVEEAVEIADERGLNDGPQRITADSPYVYLLLDDSRVQDALQDEGIDAVKYDDEDWSNTEHTCIRVFNRDAVAHG